MLLTGMGWVQLGQLTKYGAPGRAGGREEGREGEPLKDALSFAVSQPILPILAVAPLKETSTTEHILRTTAKFVNNFFVCIYIHGSQRSVELKGII